MILIRHHNEGKLTPFFYFALEQYVLNHLLKDDETYFFTWEIKGIVIGKNQIVQKEVNIPYVKEHNIPIFRRPTGGGCVYADHRNTMFSMITKKKNANFSFKDYLIKIVDAFKPLGLEIEFSGRNDLLFDGKKISGNAFMQNKNGMLMHGTLLYDCDIETMVKSITPSNEKLITKGIESVRSRVINLKDYLNNMTQEDLILHLEKHLCSKTYELSDEEVKFLLEDAKKYQTKDWIYQEQPQFDQEIEKRFPWGKLEISINIKNGLIKAISIKGDYFHLEDIKQLEKAFIDQKYTIESIEKIFKDNDVEKYILNARSEDFIELFNQVTLL